MTVERFRTEMKELDLWPSSCLLAREGDGAVAVLIATKRSDASSILRIGVLPGHERMGHGGHLLTSLSQKLAVLGPERLEVELPRARPDLQQFFAAVDYEREVALTDWVRSARPTQPVPAELFQPLTAEQADRHGLLTSAGSDRAWERQRATLLARNGRLAGIAMVTPERIEAGALFVAAPEGDGFAHGGEGTIDLWFAGCPDRDPQPRFLDFLLRHLASRFANCTLRLPRLLEDEVPQSVLAGNGFVPGATYDRWAAVATPG